MTSPHQRIVGWSSLMATLFTALAVAQSQTPFDGVNGLLKSL